MLAQFIAVVAIVAAVAYLIFTFLAWLWREYRRQQDLKQIEDTRAETIQRSTGRSKRRG
jgi:hypothetical protein